MAICANPFAIISLLPPKSLANRQCLPSIHPALPKPFRCAPLRDTMEIKSDACHSFANAQNLSRKMIKHEEYEEVELSAYDMGWIARVGKMKPQFPQVIEWIIGNQCEDGSWGHCEDINKICCTLSCVISLQVWNKAQPSILRGLGFLKAQLPLHVHKMKQDVKTIIFGMVREAQALHVKLNYEEAYIQDIYVHGQAFLERVSSEFLSEYMTSYVHVLEGVHHEVPDWNILLGKYQCSDGLVISTSLTACVYIHTGDVKCLRYLDRIVQLYKYSMPICLLEDLHFVELLEHLGIQRHFQEEVERILIYAFRYWKGNEIGNGKQQHIKCLKDAALLFRVLRGHGYEVYPDILHQLDEGAIGDSVHELCISSQWFFPGEKHSKKYDINTFDHEFMYLVRTPWYKRMQRFEHIEYITKFSLKTKPSEEKKAFDLAKWGFNACQLIYKKDLQELLRWSKNCKFSQLNYARQKDVICFFSAAATMFESELSMARIVWAKMGVLTTIIDDLFDTHPSLEDLENFCKGVQSWDLAAMNGATQEVKLIFEGLYNTVNWISQHASALQNRDISIHLRAQWERLTQAFFKEAEWRITKYCPTLEEYVENGVYSFALEPIMLSAIFFLGAKVNENMLNHVELHNMYRRVSLVGRLLNDIQGFKREVSMGEFTYITIYMKENPGASVEGTITEMRRIIEATTVELVEDILRPREMPRICKRVFENMLRILSTLYRDGDGFSNSDYLKNYINSILNVQLE